MTKKTDTRYADQAAWRELQKYLPERLQLEPDDEPVEEFWEWNGHNVHLDRYPNPDAPAKVVLHHGVGTNGRQMNLILGKWLADKGFEVTAVDNLGYGMTQVAKGTNPSYGDWIQLVTDYLAVEKAKDDRPVVLYGLSAGGMVTYHVAAHAPRGTLAGIVGMTFLDARVDSVWEAVAHDRIIATIGTSVMGLANKSALLGRFPLPMKAVSKMSALCNVEGAQRVFVKDRTSAGNVATVNFLDTYRRYAPDIEPADFDVCPILLTQPAVDRWTPLELSKPVLDPITKVPVTIVNLDNAGHYPFEEPGLTQMQDAILAFVRDVTGGDR